MDPMQINRRILIVEDDRVVHEDFRKMLLGPAQSDQQGELEALEEAVLGVMSDTPTKQPLYEIDSAYQGHQALEMVRQAHAQGAPYGLLFMDVRMPPGWDGVQTISKIWAEFPEVEMVICTAYSDYRWDDIVSQLGSTDQLMFLRKPLDLVTVQQTALALTKKWTLADMARKQLEHLEREVAERTAQLELRNRELSVAKEAAEAANLAKSQFIATVSHEIRTPLNGVLGMTDILSSTALQGEQAELVQTIASCGETLLALVEDVLDFSKIESGTLKLELTSFDLDGLLSRLSETFSAAAAQRCIKLSFRRDPRAPRYIRADSERLRKALANLLSNALKFTKIGAVELTVSPTPKGLHFEVSDTGIGISKELQGNIFKPFTQADTSTTRSYGGTGLGLSICQHLVALMGGEVQVDSEPGQGSRFGFTLAVGLPRESTQRTGEKTEERIEARILVVEDDLINQKVAKRYLERLGCEVDVAQDGQEAVERLTRNRYDAVLMDCHMPRMDGYEATREIRAREKETRRTPILALTANSHDENRQACLKAGMDDFLSKPVALDTLAAALRRCLG